MQIVVGGAEARALKTEITETVVRRLRGDARSPSAQFGVGLAAIGEAAADMIFAAARDKKQGEDLLQIFNALVRSRWNVLAAQGQSDTAGHREGAE